MEGTSAGLPSSRRVDLLATTVRRLQRRGARTKLARLLGRVRPEDVAVMLRSFTPDEQFSIFKILIAEYPKATIDVLTELEPHDRHAILEEMQPQQMAKLLELAAVDDAIFLLDSLPTQLKKEVLEIVDLEDRFAEVQLQLTYDDESAGRIMDTEFMALEDETSAADAIRWIREKAHDVDMISYLYVLDRGGHLLGVVSLRQLLLADPTRTLGDFMNASVIKAHTWTDQEEVAQLAARYDLLAIPVVDDDNKLAGIVTVDDILDIFKEEATEDFYKMVGTSDDEIVYQDRSFKVAGIRLPWILFNLAGLLLAGFVTTRFEEAFDLAMMVGFIPVIMGMAGNIGSQTSTISVRGLATGRLTLGDGRIGRFLWQQLKVGSLLAVACASLVGTVAFLYGRSGWAIPLAVGLSLFATVLLASLNGVVIPVVFKRLGIDPAVAAGPLVTTTNDVLGILIYFGLATVMLQAMG